MIISYQVFELMKTIIKYIKQLVKNIIWLCKNDMQETDVYAKLSEDKIRYLEAMKFYNPRRYKKEIKANISEHN